MPGDLFAFGGATYETFEDSAKDLDGALAVPKPARLQALHSVGHSLGCIKSLLYQGSRRRRDVVGIVLLLLP